MLLTPPKLTEKTGLPPGSIVAIGKHKPEPARIWIFQYNESGCREIRPESLDFRELQKKDTTCWINIDGLSDTSIMDQIGSELGIHNLTLEDIVTIDQVPKIEDHDHYLFLVLKMIYWNSEKNEPETEQVSFLLLHNIVLSFQERPGDVFNPIRERLRRGWGRTRKEHADYLLYSLIDAIVDGYFTVMDRIGEHIESIEEEVVEKPSDETSVRINTMRSKVTMLRRSIGLLRDVISTILRTEYQLIRPQMEPYIRDLYDHTIKVIETLETYRDTLTGLRDIFLASVSNRMNEIIKVLTMISTIFIPLSFIAGIYGMNFKYMPELEQKWAYPTLLCLMVLIASGFIIFFKRKKWL